MSCSGIAFSSQVTCRKPGIFVGLLGTIGERPWQSDHVRL